MYIVVMTYFEWDYDMWLWCGVCGMAFKGEKI